MKLFTKKTLAIVLSVLLAIGSFSLFAFAAEEGTASTNTVWYAADGTTEITKAELGDSVVAKVYLTTDFSAADIAFLFQYDSNMLELDTSKYTAVSISGTPGYQAISEIGTIEGYFIDGTNQVPSGTDTTGIGTYYFRTQGYTTKEYSEADGAFLVFYFTVKDTTPVSEIGTMKVMDGTLATEDDDTLPTNIAKVKDAYAEETYTQSTIDGSKYYTLPDYDLTFTSTSNELTVNGEVTFNAGEGKLADDQSSVTVSGYYNKNVDNAPADPEWDGYDFEGWSTVQADSEENGVEYFYGDIANKVDVETVKYADPAANLYAIWRVATTTYDINVWKPVLDGKDLKKDDTGAVYYEKDTELSKEAVGGTVGQEVSSAAEVTVPDGYTVAQVQPNDPMTLVQDSTQNVMDIQLDLSKNPIKWVVYDGSVENTVASDEAYVGTDLSLFEDPDYAGTTDPESDFYGYTVEWTDHSSQTMPNAEYTITGTKGDPVDVKLICEAGSATDPVTGNTVTGSFTGSDGTKTYKYGDAVTDAPTYVPPTNFKVTGWTYTDASGATQTVDSLAALADLLKTNYTFGTDGDALTVTVTPVLEPVTDGTVTFNANGGTFADDTSSKDVAGQIYGSAVTGPDSEPTKKDGDYTYTFKGWAADPNAAPADAKQVSELGNYTAPTTFYAIYEDSRITVTWQYQDGTVIKTVKDVPIITGLDSKYPSTATVLDFISEPDKTNYATGYEITWDKEITEASEDTVITGTFEKIDSNIVYVDEEGNILEVFTGKYGDTVSGTAPEVPAKDNYTGEWDNALPSTYDAWTDSITGTYEGTEQTFANALIIKPVYTAIDKITVTYQHADGSTETVDGYEGDPVTAPELTDADQKTGYNASWSEDVTEIPSADKTVTVAYTPVDVKVRLNPDNGDSATEQTVPYNETITVPDENPEKDGADFIGWFTPDGTEFDPSKTLEENGIDPSTLLDGILTLTAKYGVKDTYYNVTAVNDDGTFTYSATDTFTTEDPENETYTVPSDPTLTGFTFNGWATTENATASDATPDGTFGTTSRDFYPVYEINKHTVTYVPDNGEEDTVYSDVAYAAEVPKPADPTKEGYTFAGWTPAVPATMPDEDLTFTATWNEIPVESDEYTATYYNEGSVHAQYVIKEGDPVTVPEDPERFGYIFEGWEPEIPATMPGENIDFVAKWKLDPTWIVLGIGGAAVAGTVIGASAATNAALITGGAIVGTVAVVALAKNTHKVTYLVDGEVYKVYYLLTGVKVIVPKDPTKEGYEFEGWTPEIPERMPDSDLVFEAQFSDGSAPIDDVIPNTGSATAGLAAFAVISSAAAAAYIVSKRKKEF